MSEQTRTWKTREGETILPKGQEKYTEAARAALVPSIWTEAGQVLGEMVDGEAVTLYAIPSVTKVCEYEGKRWAWMHLASGVKIKVYENSSRAKALGVVFDAGKHRPVVHANRLVVVTGHLRSVESGWTIGDPWVYADPSQAPGFDEAVASAVVEKFVSAHVAALDGLDVFEAAE